MVAVVEFGDLALADRLAERFEAARFFRNGHGDDGFATFTQLSPLGYMAQTVEVDVGARVDGYQSLAANTALFDVFFDPRHAQRASRFGD